MPIEDSQNIEKTNEVEEEVDADKMRVALSAIAQEMHKYRGVTACLSNYDLNNCDEISKTLKICKSKLKLKKLQIRRLKQHLKSACVIAKTVVAAKEQDTYSLKNHLTSARNQFTNLMKQNEENSETIQKLTIENHVLRDKLQNIHNFIDLGYQELQKMRDDNQTDLSIIMKLKQIMLCCGEYYAKYCNEHEKCLQLEQRNRFLSNKISILENNLEAASDQLRSLQYKKIQKSKIALKDKKAKTETNSQKIGYVRSEYVFEKNKTGTRTSVDKIETVKGAQKKHVSSPDIENLDLTSHLSLVKNLLNDQDTMLRDLKKLSEEMKFNDKTNILNH